MFVLLMNELITGYSSGVNPWKVKPIMRLVIEQHRRDRSKVKEEPSALVY